MTSTYLIKDDEGAVINTIVADADFVEAAYPGRFELVEVEEPSPAQTTYKVITPTRYLALVKMASQMTNAEFAAYDTDPHADMVYTRAMLASISGMIDINIPDNMALVMEGLGYMATHGHTGQIDPGDFTDTILAAWATLQAPQHRLKSKPASSRFFVA